MKSNGGSKRIIGMLLALAVIICGLSACGSDKAESSSEADASAAGNSDTASTAEPEASGAVLTVTVNKKTAEAKKSSRPYDASKQNISLILVVGQSNFTTSVGFSSELAAFNSGKTTAFPERPTQPAAGTAYSCSASMNGRPIPNHTSARVPPTVTVCFTVMRSAHTRAFMRR